MKKQLSLSVMLLSVILGLGQAHAAQFSSMYVFGDSLSDGGASPTAALSIFKILQGNCDPFHPCPPYVQGHYSNGPVAAEYLANAILPGGANSGNFASLAIAGSTSGIGNYGDLGTQTTRGLLGFPGMAQQVILYLNALANAGVRAPSDALFMVWGGANDYLSGSSPVSAAQNIATYVALLAYSGAQSILVPNIPDLSRTPTVISDGNAAIQAAFAFTQSFNQTLSDSLDFVSGLFPATHITRFDTYTYFNSLAQNPAAYGFSNVTDACVNLPNVCADPSTHVFWDDIHPTTNVHRLLADAMAAELMGSSVQAFAAPVPLPAAGLLFAAGLTWLSRRRLSR